MNKIIFDLQTTPERTSREMTPEGYLKVPAKVSRIGIQNYRAGELGIDGYPKDEILCVFRPASEVFSKKSLESFKDKDVTIEHPDDLIDSKNFRKCTVGHCISCGRREGDFVVVDLLIKDKDAIDAIQRGKVNLSAGYTANFDEKSGTYKNQPFSHVQSDIYINHIALVDNPRAGDDAKLFDSRNKKMPFNFFKKNVTVVDDDAIDSINNTFQKFENTLTTIKSDIESLKEQQNVRYDANDSDSVNEIVQAVKNRIIKDESNIRLMIRKEINRAIKNS